MREPNTTQKIGDGRIGWRTVRHYAYIERSYDAACATLVEFPRQVLGDCGPDAGAALSELRVHRAGVELAADAVAGFVHDVARRLEALLPVESIDPATTREPDGEIDDPGHRRIHVQLDGLGERRGGAVGISR